LGIPVCPYDK